jgi:bacteriocin biosynthesis cyclodehydratase domain-containing protein
MGADASMGSSDNDRSPLTSLRPGAHILRISADTIQVAFPNYTATLKSPPVVKAATELLDLFRNPVSRDDAVCSVAESTQLTEPFVSYVVETLDRCRCLMNVYAGEDHAKSNPFFGYVSENPQQLSNDLGAARTLLVHFGSTCEPLALATNSGLVGTTEVGIEAGASCQTVLTRITGALDDRTMMIVWGLPYRLGLTASINDLAIAAGKPVLFGACEGIVGRVGPYVIPGNTACLDCATNRLLSNAGAPEIQMVRSFRARHSDLVPEPWPTHSVFELAVFAQLMLEVTRIAGRLGSQTIGGLLEYRFGDGCAERHTVLRVPRCPSCHPARPSRLAWDAIFPAPVVKNSV